LDLNKYIAAGSAGGLCLPCKGLLPAGLKALAFFHFCINALQPLKWPNIGFLRRESCHRQVTEGEIIPSFFSFPSFRQAAPATCLRAVLLNGTSLFSSNL